MKLWHTYSLLALGFYGLWAFFPKLAANTLDSKSIVIYQTLGVFVVGMAFMKFYPGSVTLNFRGILFAILGGASGMIGTFFYLNALKNGSASVVIITTALYPVIAVLLVFLILKEVPNPRQILGMCFALVALYFFAKS